MHVAVCGGGSLAHAVVAVVGARDDVQVRVLTRQPQRWSREVRGIYLDVAEVRGRVAVASSDPQRVVAGADVVLLCVPACARERVLTDIAPFVDTRAWIGCFPGFGGFDWQARGILGPQARIFGLQRVPYVRKTISYGEAVWISGIRPRLVLGAYLQRMPRRGALDRKSHGYSDGCFAALSAGHALGVESDISSGAHPRRICPFDGRRDVAGPDAVLRRVGRCGERNLPRARRRAASICRASADMRPPSRSARITASTMPRH